MPANAKLRLAENKMCSPSTFIRIDRASLGLASPRSPTQTRLIRKHCAMQLLNIYILEYHALRSIGRRETPSSKTKIASEQKSSSTRNGRIVCEIAAKCCLAQDPPPAFTVGKMSYSSWWPTCIVSSGVLVCQGKTAAVVVDPRHGILQQFCTRGSTFAMYLRL